MELRSSAATSSKRTQGHSDITCRQRVKRREHCCLKFFTLLEPVADFGRQSRDLLVEQLAVILGCLAADEAARRQYVFMLGNVRRGDGSTEARHVVIGLTVVRPGAAPSVVG